MIYAVSDLHGCYDKYIKLLERLKMTSDDSLYILGDIVDRGSDGMKILLDLIKRKNVFSCRGNHDHCAQILLRSFAIPNDGYFADGLEETFRLWLSDGGSPTYEVIAYKLSNKIDTQLAVDTVNMAVANRGKSTGIIFHTDRGCQFTSSVFRRYLDNLNMIQSFSAKGHPYDNAVMECFFKYLKKEEVNRKSYSSFDELNVALFQYINGFYNSLRPHSHNNGLSPNQAETSFY